jgi:hypothetical protein
VLAHYGFVFTLCFGPVLGLISFQFWQLQILASVQNSSAAAMGN